MNLKEIKLPWPRGVKYQTVIACSCTHKGAAAADDEGRARLYEKCRRLPWLHHGDVIDGIIPSDVRYDVELIRDSLLSQIRSAAEEITKARKTCLGIIQGNHEAKPSKLVGCITNEIALQAKVPYLGLTCMITVQCPGGSFRWLARHGRDIYTARAGNPKRRKHLREEKMRRGFQDFHADLYGQGHAHIALISPPLSENKLSVRDSQIKQTPIEIDNGWCYTAPSLLKNYALGIESYAENLCLRPTGIGWLEIVVRRDGTIDRIRHVNQNGETVEERTSELV